MKDILHFESFAVSSSDSTKISTATESPILQKNNCGDDGAGESGILAAELRMAVVLSFVYIHQLNYLSESPVDTFRFGDFLCGFSSSKGILTGHSRRKRSGFGDATTGSIGKRTSATQETYFCIASFSHGL